MSAGPTEKRDRLVEAAARAKAPYFVFKLWLIEHAEKVSTSLWGQWKSGKRPVSSDYVLRFVQDDDWVPDEATITYLQERLAAKRAKEALKASDAQAPGSKAPGRGKS